MKDANSSFETPKSGEIRESPKVKEVKSFFSTTLYVPFYFKEKEKGDYLKRGFEIDYVLEKYFKQNEENQFSFLKIGRVDDNRIAEALARIALRQ
jgi:hypothetical protein